MIFFCLVMTIKNFCLYYFQKVRKVPVWPQYFINWGKNQAAERETKQFSLSLTSDAIFATLFNSQRIFLY